MDALACSLASYHWKSEPLSTLARLMSGSFLQSQSRWRLLRCLLDEWFQSRLDHAECQSWFQQESTHHLSIFGAFALSLHIWTNPATDHSKTYKAHT